MGPFFTTVCIIAIWVISFVEPSGWSIALHLPDKINFLCAAAAVFYFLSLPHRRQDISPILFWTIILTFIVIPVIFYGSFQGASYLVSFLIVYIISQGTISPRVIKLSGIAVAIGGLIIMYIYVYGSLLSGWNDNNISMVGLFSFLYFTIFLISKKGTKMFWVWNIVTLIYISLLFKTECRSGMLFSLLAVCAIFFDHKTKSILSKKWIRVLLINIPLMISFLVIWFSTTPLYNTLNTWSIENFDKLIFSAREILWDAALVMLEKSGFIGTGKFMINYHNSGIAILSVFGILGYICWATYFTTTLKQIQKYLQDDIVFGSLVAFVLIYLQQSVDLGFVGEVPNLLPYMILGVALSRIRQLNATPNQN